MCFALPFIRREVRDNHMLLPHKHDATHRRPTHLKEAIHRSAWKVDSQKLNLRFTAFSEDGMRRPTPHTQYP